MDVKTLERTLLDRFPAEHAEAWDNVGMLVGDPSREVTGVLCALDATPETIARASALGCNVLVTHHPIYIKAPESFEPLGACAPSSGTAIYEAARLGVSVISLHTNFDRSLEAREALAAALDIPSDSSLEHPDDPSSIGYGVIGDLPGTGMALDDLARAVSARMGTDARIWGDSTRIVCRVAVLGGSLGSFGDDAIAAGADVVITGEAGYHVLLDLAERGLSVILLGHDRSEQPFCRALAAHVEAVGIPADRIQVHAGPVRWHTVRQGELV